MWENFSKKNLPKFLFSWLPRWGCFCFVFFYGLIASPLGLCLWTLHAIELRTLSNFFSEIFLYIFFFVLKLSEIYAKKILSAHFDWKEGGRSADPPPPLPRQKKQIWFFLEYVSDNFKTKKNICKRISSKIFFLS